MAHKNYKYMSFNSYTFVHTYVLHSFYDYVSLNVASLKMFRIEIYSDI